MKRAMWLFLVFSALLGVAVSAEARGEDLNHQYRAYLETLPRGYFSGKMGELDAKPGYGDIQLCGHYYAHFEEYTTYCKDYEHADMLRLSACMSNNPTMLNGLMNKCKPGLNRTEYDLRDEMRAMYKTARQKYSEHSFYPGFLLNFLSAMRDQLTPAELKQVTQDILVAIVTMAKGQTQWNLEDSRYIQMGKDHIDPPSANPPPSSENNIRNLFDNLWFTCELLLEKYPECGGDVYLAMKENGLLHLLHRENRRYGGTRFASYPVETAKPGSGENGALKAPGEETAPAANEPPDAHERGELENSPPQAPASPEPDSSLKAKGAQANSAPDATQKRESDIPAPQALTSNEVDASGAASLFWLFALLGSVAFFAVGTVLLIRRWAR